MPNASRPIGVFDSGIGGLTVLKHLARHMPDEHFVYLGDTARVPYGNRSSDTVRTYAQECAQFLAQHNVKMVVVACNTVSAVALDVVEETLAQSNGNREQVPVIGVIEPAAQAAVRSSKSKRIGVIGTRATIASDAYAIAIKKATKAPSPQGEGAGGEFSNEKGGVGGEFAWGEFSIHSRACPLFVPLVEEGWVDSAATRLIAEEYLRPLLAQQIDTLVLGCTHYPVLVNVLADLMPGVTLIDCGACATEVAAARIGYVQSGEVHQPVIDMYVTDNTPTFGVLARQFLGMPVDDPVRVTLDTHHEVTT